MTHRIAACLVLGFVSALTGCESMRPRIERVTPRVASLDLQGVDLVFDLDVYNHSPVPLMSPSGRYALKVAGTQFMQSDSVPPIDVPARGRGVVSLPARVQYEDLWRMFRSLGDANEVDYEFTGALTPTVAGKELEMGFSHKGKMPVFRAPRLKVADVRTSGTSLSSPEVLVDADITNPNIFRVGVSDLGYLLMVDDAEIGALRATTLEDVLPGKTGRMTLAGTVSAATVLSRIMAGDGLANAKIVPIGRVSTPFGPVDLQRRVKGIPRDATLDAE